MQLKDLLTLATQFVSSRTLQTAVSLGIFEALTQKTLTAEQIARKIKGNDRGTKILLDALVALKLLGKTKGRYRLTPFARKYLLEDSPTSYTAMLALIENNFRGFADLDKAVKTGRSVGRANMFQDDPKMLDHFITAMHNLAVVRGDAKLVSQKIPLKGYDHLIDIGGGPGSYAIAFCQKNPQLTAAVYDLPATCKVTRRLLKKNDKTKRVSVIEGNYLKDPFPPHFDVAFVSNIVHSENERDNLRLVKKIYQGLAPGGMILIKDHLLNDDHTAPLDGALFALTMLLFTRGRSYSATEIKGWLRKAGFSKIRHLKMPAPMTSGIISAIK